MRITNLSLITVCTALTATTTLGATLHWDYPTVGAFGGSQNWVEGIVPGVNDDARFSQIGVSTVNFPVNVTTQNADFIGGFLTLHAPDAPRTWTVVDSVRISANLLELDRRMVVHAARADVSFGELNVRGGAVLRSDGRIPVHWATVRVEGGGSLIESPSGMELGRSGRTARLEVRDGGQVEVQRLRFSTLDDPGTVGEGLFESGAVVRTDELGLATAHGAATVTVRDPGTLLQVRDELQLGGSPDALAILNIGLDAALDLGTNGNFVNPNGYLDVADGTLTVDGDLDVDGGTWVAANGAQIGVAPGVTITARNGGTIDWDRSLSANSPDAAEPITYDVLSGGFFEVSFSCTLGGTAGTAGAMVVDGGRVEADAFVPSTFRGANGGGGADLRVGVGGHGTLAITGGGFMQLRDDGVFGQDLGSSALVEVIGADIASLTPSTLDLTVNGTNSTLVVGQFGDATLEIIDGGVLRVGGGARIGTNAPGVGTIVVDGTESGLPATLDVGTDMWLSAFGSGPRGAATLTVGDGGRVDVGDDLTVGTGGGGTGGTALLDILAGGTVAVVDAVAIGSVPPTGGDATVRVHAGGALTAGNNAGIGQTATLDLAGGVFSGPPLLTIAGRVEGNGELAVGTVSSFGTIDPGHGTTKGTITIGGHLVQDAGGTLRIDASGVLAGEFDRVEVAGDVDLDGTLEIVAPPGALAAGDALNVIAFEGAALDATFDTVLAPDGLTATVAVVGQNIRVTFSGAGCPADIDGSGAVDFGDILAILAAWGGAGGPEDLDGSGTVDFGDLLVVLGAWGPCV